MEILLQRLERIEAKLDRVLNQEPPELIDSPEAMKLTGLSSRTTLLRWAAKHGIQRVSHGKWRRRDFINRIKQLSLNPN